MCRTPVRPAASVSPFDQVDAALLTLSAAPWPLTLPAALLTDAGSPVAWPVDVLRARMAHPSTPCEARGRVWAEIMRRHRTHGEPWGTVAVAMVIPALRRSVGRLPRLTDLELCEVEQEALAAVTDELAQLGPDEEMAGLRLLRAGDRAAHRLQYAVLRERRTRPLSLDEAYVPNALPTTTEADVYAVLERATASGVLTRVEAELIAATRLEGQSAKICAQDAGMSVRAMFRRRSAAEQRLTKALLSREL